MEPTQDKIGTLKKRKAERSAEVVPQIEEYYGSSNQEESQCHCDEMEFVNAIFKIGLENSTPKSILGLMPVNDVITTDIIKSHLQKFRAKSSSSHETFKTFYEDSLLLKLRPNRRRSTISSIELIQFMNKSREKDIYLGWYCGVELIERENRRLQQNLQEMTKSIWRKINECHECKKECYKSNHRIDSEERSNYNLKSIITDDVVDCLLHKRRNVSSPVSTGKEVQSVDPSHVPLRYRTSLFREHARGLLVSPTDDITETQLFPKGNRGTQL